MNEISPILDKNYKDISKYKEKDYEEETNESESSSVSTLSTNKDTDNLIDKSKLLQKNKELLIVEDESERRLSAPISFSEYFVLNFIKIGKETRSSYYNSLSTKGLLNSSTKEKKFKFNNIFIFDWDDTLLCTTVLSPLGYFDDNMTMLPSKIKKIKKLEISVKKILSLTIDKGDTYIITNSVPGWVQYSCKKFFPNIYELLNKVKIISARGLYEKKYPKDFKIWKLKAFNEIVEKYEKDLPTNIICFGDSDYEIEAAHGLIGKFPNGFIKAIKFKELPKIFELINQINIVLDKFNFIYSACKNWNITIEKKKNKK